MNQEFPCMAVKLLFTHSRYDGPNSGVCEYNGEKLYFDSLSELMFAFPETDPECIKMDLEDNEEPKQYHRLRIYSVYRLPKEVMDVLDYNNQVWEKLLEDRVENYSEVYKKVQKPIPGEIFNNFKTDNWKWRIGYTTEDVWDTREYYKKRNKAIDKK